MRAEWWIVSLAWIDRPDFPDTKVHMASFLTSSPKNSPIHEHREKNERIDDPSHPSPPPSSTANPSIIKEHIISDLQNEAGQLKNEVCECRKQMRSQEERLVEHGDTLSMVLKLINKTPKDDVGTSKGMEVHF